MITQIEIDGFKTFNDFKMEFSPLTIIAGTNSSGKSNLFDALQLLSRVAESDLRTAFSEQRGNAEELFTQYSENLYATKMSFAVEVLLNKDIKDNWGRKENLKYTRLRYEIRIERKKNDIDLDQLYVEYEQLTTIKHDDDKWTKLFLPNDSKNFWRPKVPAGRRTTPYIETDLDQLAIFIRQDGQGGLKKKFSISSGITQSILSGVNSIDFMHAFALKEELLNWKFLQLSPQSLREPSRQDIGMKDTITQSGGNLAAALYRIKLNNEYALKDISRKLNNLLPNLVEVDVYNDKANKQFIIKVKSEDKREFSSRVLSEGTLRLLALCIFQFDDHHNGLLCFEEPENGIHPGRIKEMVNLLVDLSVDFLDTETNLRQVIVNTHSPLLVEEAFNTDKNDQITVWFSQLVTKFINLNSNKPKLHVTKMLPVDRDAKFNKNGISTIIFPDAEKKLILNQLKNYLSKPDFNE